MEKTVDCRGLACPQPVIQTKKALDGMKEGKLVTIVDNQVAKENVRKMAEKLNIGVEIEEKEDLYHITLTQGGLEEAERMDVSPISEGGKLVILIGQDRMGGGSDELGRILINSYLYSLTETQPRPDQLIFVNSGVKLACSGSKSLENIKKLEELGVEVLSCGTCLDFFELKEDLQVGGVTNMYTIVEALNGAGKTIVL